MTAVTDHSQGDEGFRLSQLLYDTRYRSVTIQIIALLALIAGLGWLLNNAVSNLAAAGQDFNFGFLGSVAGYDINQRLIEYDSQMTHGRATLVGLLNTLLVAVLGCITCTVIGVIMGVLRLSPNWIVRQLSAVYVEAFRNVPVLLWIVLIMGVMIKVPPQPRAFRGDNPDATMSLWDSVAITNRGIYIPRPTYEAGSALVVGVFLASIVAIFAFRWFAKKRQEETGQILPVFWVGLGLFFVPAILTQLVMGSPIGLEYPELAGFNFSGGIHLRNSLIALWIALSLYTGAFVAENVRAGILSVSKGQTEAAASLGIRPNRIMNLVVLPQALRVIIPPMISNYLNLTKNSSLALAIGYMDLTGTLGNITRNQTGREMESVLLLMAIYLSLSLSISAVGNWYNNSVKLKER
ncbi:amino acid ABC transporter permease [Pontivivens insulae]|uniref:Putative glutamine ABC transporter permease protein GlnM n=1 Tax=Pontivivens insulae TaxID=1639689 RepID=A0A2R8A672_9RHOB|nr:ABC transporter permease subunit [Pontivivens insulae]RED17844.1 L-glutamine ABC transporter membrane protein /L-glutamate ABC transporter membrane protein /L-aspartate ABC transporter membrane protein /L-asparagine ABC transporter membrane protein [Pontivivens insulae]SPF27734.1 putative glutamine ABC transporter permease protein GlnM [Pontivivens insulae]